MKYSPLLPGEIEAESFRRIARRVGDHGLPEEVWPVARRVVHTTADLEFLDTFRWHADAIRSGIQALRQSRPIVTDTRMLLAGISTGRLRRLGVEARTFVDDPHVAEEAARQGVTRSAAAMEKAAPLLQGGIAAIGNAPTALFRLLELVETGDAQPALIVGTPVGFVNAAEAKEALLEAPCPYLTFLGVKGGSAVAAAVINALAQLALEEDES